MLKLSLNHRATKEKPEKKVKSILADLGDKSTEGVFSLVKEAGWKDGIPQGEIEIRILNFQVVEDSEDMF